MNKGQWTVVVIAAVFLMIVMNSLFWNIEREVRGICVVTKQVENYSPEKNFQVLYSIKECPNGKETVSLAIRNPKKQSEYSILLEAPASYTSKNGTKIHPVSFALRWLDESNLEIRYPKGLLIYAEKESLVELGSIQYGKNLYYGLNVNFKAYSL